MGFYKEFLAERDEILRHKDIESEKAGCDIGFERALLDCNASFGLARRPVGATQSWRSYAPPDEPLDRLT